MNQPAMTNSPPDSDASNPDREMGVHETARRAKLQRLVELGHDPWGRRFDDVTPISEIRAREGEIVVVEPQDAGPAGAESATQQQPGGSDSVGGSGPVRQTGPTRQRAPEMHGPQVRAAGRILLMRPTGKLIFLNIQDWTGEVQLFIGKNQVGEANWELAQCFDLGDLIGVDGELKRTKTGELTIFVEQLHFLTKSIESPPEKHHGLSDPELRQRMRYLDLNYTEGVAARFQKRTKIVSSIRRTLDGRRFMEIEGPTLHSIAGGAAARPFKTHHNALDIPLFMRIALELHLKRLLVGGFERVYELGRVYRNEGISPRHNPEFTMLEVYQAYGDYRSMMDLTEAIIVDAINATGQPRQLSFGGKEYDFTPPFQRRTYDELFQEHTGINPADAGAVRKLADEIGFNTAGAHPDIIKSEVFEERVEDSLVGPIFVMDYPSSICPLTKRKRENPAVAERFELFIAGMEVANAYTELNDPDLQAELFRTQLAGQKEDDSMAKMDHDFIRALRHGMPPAGGLGIGIDRLVMLLTDATTIRDVILFPLLRPEAE